MRKIIIGISVVCVLCLTIVVLINGIGILNINGIKSISKKDEIINEKIVELDNSINNQYKSALARLSSTLNLFENSKTEYNQQLAMSSLNKSSYATQTEKYNVDYLLTKIGNYAKEEDVILKAKIEPSEVVQDYYHLNFMVWGTYLYTANFIYDIESDSKLGFKIDNFKMVPYYVDPSKYEEEKKDNGNNKEKDAVEVNLDKIRDEKIDVVCTFTCKDIPINALTLEEDEFLTKEMFEIKNVEEKFDTSNLDEIKATDFATSTNETENSNGQLNNSANNNASSTNNNSTTN